MENWLKVKNSFFVPDKTYNAIAEHLKTMNSWEFPEDSILKDKQGKFTLEDSFIDLIGKGFIRYE